MQTPYDSQLKKKLIWSMLISVFVIFSVYSFILTTLYVKAYTDVNFMIPVFIDIIPYITTLTEIAGILVSYAFIMYVVFRFDVKTVRTFVTLSVLLTFYKYLAKIAVTYMTNGVFPEGTFLYSAIMALVEYAILAVFLFILYLVFKKVKHFINSKEALASNLSGYSFDEKLLFFPFKKLFNKQNPLQRTAFYAALITALTQILNLLVADIQIGPPTDLTDLLWMITAYTSCLVLFFASYLFILYVLMILNNKDIKT